LDELNELLAAESEQIEEDMQLPDVPHTELPAAASTEATTAKEKSSTRQAVLAS